MRLHARTPAPIAHTPMTGFKKLTNLHGVFESLKFVGPFETPVICEWLILLFEILFRSLSFLSACCLMLDACCLMLDVAGCLLLAA